MKLHTLLACFTLVALAQQTLAEPLTEAKINQIVNDVKVVEPRQGARPAALQDSIKGDLGVATGIQSRAELLFQDNTLTRLGAETFFSFQPGTRNLNLNRGSMLLQVPKEHGGAHIRAASVSASITGTTIMMEVLANKSVKIVVMEGSLRVAVDARPHEDMLLRAGRMIIVNPDAKQLPKPVEVNLRKLVDTSALVDPALFMGKTKGSAAVLPSMALIEKVIAQQAATAPGQTLVAANFDGAATSTTQASTGSAATPASSNLTLAPANTTTSVIDTIAVAVDAATTPAGTVGAGTAASGSTANSATGAGAAGSGTDISSTDTSATGSGTTGSGTTGSGTGGSGTGGSGTGGSGTGGSGTGGSGTGGSGTGGSGTGGSGTGGSGTGGSGTGGSGTGGSGTGGSGTGGSGTGGSGTGGSGTGGSGTGGSGTGGSGTGGSGTTTVTDASLPTPVITPPSNNNPNPTVLPPTIVTATPYVIDTTTVINTNQATPSIATQGVTNNGLFFQNTQKSGSASKFLFNGSSSLFDAQQNFDTNFNQQFSNTGVYKFTALELGGTPTITTGPGSNRIALVANGDITTSAVAGSILLSGPQQLFLGTVNGAISIGSNVAFNKVQGSSLNYVELYARGVNGNIDFAAPVTLQDGQLYLTAQNDVTIEPTASITTNIASITGMGNVTFDGTVNSNLTQLYAGSMLTTTGTIGGQFFYGFGANANIGSTINVNHASFTIGSNLTFALGAAVTTQKLDATAGGLLEIDGTVGATDSMTLKAGNLVVNGTLNTPGTLQATANTVSIAGTVTGTNTNATYTVAQTFTEAAGASLSQNQLTITTGGGITLGTVTNGNQTALTAGTDSLQTGNIVFNGPVTTQQLNASGANVTVNNTITGNQATFNTTGDFLSNVGGNISTSGGGQGLTITSGGGITLDGATTAQTASLTAGTNSHLVGDIHLNGSLQVQNNFNVSGSAITLNGLLTTQNSTFTSGSNFVLTNVGGITSNGSTTITAPTLIELDGQISTPSLSGPGSNGSVVLGGSAAVLINGAVQTQSLSSADHSTLQDVTINSAVTLSKDLTMTSGGNFTLANTGSINATGNVNVTATKGLTLDGATTANTVNLTSSNGDLTTNAAITAVGSVSTSSKNATVNANVSGNQLGFTTNQDFSLAVGANLNSTQDVQITSGGNVTLSGSSTSNNLVATANNLITVDGTVQASGNVQLGAGAHPANDATISGAITAKSITIDANNTLTLASTGVLTSTGGVSLDAQKMYLDGQVSGVQVTLGDHNNNTLSVGGTIQSQSLTANGGTGIFDGNITTSVQDLKINLTSGFTEGAGASLLSAGNLQVTSNGATMGGSMGGTNVTVTSSGNLSVNPSANLIASNTLTLSGNAVVIDGSLNAPTVKVTGSNSLILNNTSGYISADTVSLNTAGSLTLSASSGGAGGVDLARLTSLTASGSGIVVSNDFTLSGGNSTLTTGNAGILATGADLSGFKTITINNGSYTGASLSVDTLNINQNGNLALTGDLTSTGNVSVPGTVSVAGAITANDVTAGKGLTADSLSGHNVTVNNNSDLSVTGDLTSTGNVSVQGSVSAGGTITANQVTAGKDLTAQSLSVGNLSAASLTVGSGGITSYAGGTSQINTPTIKSALGVFMNGTAGTPSSLPGDGGSLQLTTGSLTVDGSSSSAGTLTTATFNGGDADPSRFDAGGNGGTFNLNSSGDFTVNSPISATTGKNSTTGMTGGNGGTVNVTASGAITVNSDIKVSSTETSANPSDNTPRRASRNGGNVNLTSNKTSGTAIAVNNTGQILALLNAASPGHGGTINFTSAGGDINVNGGRIQADKGTVNVVNNGMSGQVQLTNATVSADVVKIGALGANGQLIIGGGTINADTSLKLYGGTSNGQVHFTDDVTLGGASTKIIAGKTVTIDNGKTVTVGGNSAANVYTDHANYTGLGANNSTTGKFGGKGANAPSAYINAPGF